MRRSFQVITLSIVMVGAGLVSQGQDPAPQNPNPSQTKQNTTRKQRPSQSKPQSDATSEQSSPSAPSVPTSQTTTQQRTAADQTDLSGTYAGTFSCDEAGLSGDTTLTITGNQFSTSEGHRGRIVATTTSGYTAVAFQPETAGAVQSSVISLRAKKIGNRLILSPASGSTVTCSFGPTRGAASARRKLRPAGMTSTEATGTNVSNPAEVGPAPPDVTKPAPGKSKSKKVNKTAPTPTQSTSPSQTVTPQPVPAESPMPMQTPSPSPTTPPSERIAKSKPFAESVS